MNAWRLFVAALVLPLLFTTVVLIDVQRNRTGARQPIALSEREVALSTGSDENSGMTAWLTWADPDPAEGWVSRDTLRSLGFDLSPLAPGFPGRVPQLQRRAYVALELRNDSPTRSRLVPVAAAIDREMLTARYPDGRTHLVTAGVIGMRQVARPGGTESLEAYLANIDPRGIHVPTEFAARLRGPGRSQVFTLSLRYGSRLDPWVVDVTR